jgi:3-hydroxybutyryl-CoA dehydrogenase
MAQRQIGVIGAGQMGQGIAQVAASLGGETVTVYDVSATQCDKARTAIGKSLDKLAEKGTITLEQAAFGHKNIHFTQGLGDLDTASVVIEAAPENLSLKCELFQQLDTLCPPETILASNTSSISLTTLAAATKRPDRVIGMHFMNPVPLMSLVELIRAQQTSDATAQQIHALAERFGKTVVTSADYPGFLANRILMPMLNEAMFALYEGVGTADDIDTTMKLGMRHPMGPLQLADFIGLDTCLAILNVLYDGFKDPKYRPCPLLVNLVTAGHVGKKAGKGFYTYDSH